MAEVEVHSLVHAPADRVWEHATSVAGINAELSPWLRMSAPAGLTQLGDAGDLPLGEPWFTSWVWALGWLPVDRMHVTPVAIEPGTRFLERSSLLSLRLWQHERLVLPAEGGTRVVDRLTAVPRLPGADRLVGACVGALFRHRHRRLATLFG